MLSPSSSPAPLPPPWESPALRCGTQPASLVVPARLRRRFPRRLWPGWGSWLAFRRRNRPKRTRVYRHGHWDTAPHEQECRKMNAMTSAWRRQSEQQTGRAENSVAVRRSDVGIRTWVAGIETTQGMHCKGRTRSDRDRTPRFDLLAHLVGALTAYVLRSQR